MSLFSNWELLAKTQYNSTVSGFMVTTNTLLQPLHITLGIPVLAYFALQYPMITSEHSLPAPHQLWLYILTTLASFWMLSNTVWNLRMAHITQGLLSGVFGFLEIVNQLLVGVSVSNLIAKLDMKKGMIDCKSVELTCSTAMTEFAALKKGLSPLLFLLFLTNALFTIFNLYYLITMPAIRFALAPILVVSILKLTYISLVLEDCYQSYRSIPKEIRSKHNLTLLISEVGELWNFLHNIYIY